MNRLDRESVRSKIVGIKKGYSPKECIFASVDIPEKGKTTLA